MTSPPAFSLSLVRPGVSILFVSRDGGDTEFVDDFSDMLLLKLFNLAIAGCHDNDKVKYNTVRALGSLLHYLPARSVGEFTSQYHSLL